MRPSRIRTITSVACGKKGKTQAATHDLYNLCKLESYKQFAGLLLLIALHHSQVLTC